MVRPPAAGADSSPDARRPAPADRPGSARAVRALPAAGISTCSRELKLRGQEGLLALIEQLEGFEAPAGHWEKYLLPARLEAYDPAWLDALTFFGQVAWGRLRPLARPTGATATAGR